MFNEIDHLSIGLVTKDGFTKVVTNDACNVMPISREEVGEQVIKGMEKQRGEKLYPVITLRFKTYEC